MASANFSDAAMPEEDKIRIDRSNEYATQFLGFSPVSVTDGIYNAIYDYAHDILSSLQKYITSTFAEVTTEERISKGTEEVLQKSIALLNKVFDRLELYLKTNILNVPDHVLLPEDEVHSSGKNELSSDEVQQKIELVEQQIKEERRRRVCLIEGRRRQILILEQYDKFLGELEDLNKMMLKHGVFDVSESLLFIQDQLGKINSNLKRTQSKENGCV